MPMLLAVGVVAEGVFLFFLVLFIDAGDILLDFALEDERFFELAIRCTLWASSKITSIGKRSRKTAGAEICDRTSAVAKPLIRTNVFRC